MNLILLIANVLDPANDVCRKGDFTFQAGPHHHRRFSGPSKRCWRVIFTFQAHPHSGPANGYFHFSDPSSSAMFGPSTTANDVGGVVSLFRIVHITGNFLGPANVYFHFSDPSLSPMFWPNKRLFAFQDRPYPYWPCWLIRSFKSVRKTLPLMPRLFHSSEIKSIVASVVTGSSLNEVSRSEGFEGK